MTAYDFTFRSVDGATLALDAYRGKPFLVVNTASQCGFTPQYRDLQTLWKRYGDAGLVVLGIPSNDFGEQEPGEESEIREFCHVNYGISFPLAGKHKVTGGDAHPFFRWLEAEYGEVLSPRWNFHKYLIGPDGTLAGTWPSKVEPLSDEITSAVEALLET